MDFGFRAGRPPHVEGARTLVVAAAILWGGFFVILNIGWPGSVMEHPVERALRRIVTCGAGFGVSLAMVPFLARVASLSIARQAALGLGLSLVAQLAHAVFRLAVFHMIDPLWGPPTWDIFLVGLQGGGWVFPMWCAICLAVMSHARAAALSGGAPPAPACTSSDLWTVEGRRRVRVPLEEVVLLTAEGDYVRLWCPSRQYLVRGRLKDIAGLLPADRYMRVHRSTVVRLDAARAMERAGSAWRLRLADGLEAQVSRAMGAEVRRRIARA